MATATGDIALDASGLANVDPFTDPLVTPIGEGVRVVSGAFRTRAVGDGGFLSATAPSNAVHSSSVEVAGGNGDPSYITLFDVSGNGYVLRLSSGEASIQRYAAFAFDVQLGGWVPGFVAGDVFKLEIDEATGEITATKNGTLVGTPKTDTTHTGLRGGFFHRWDNLGVNGIISWAATGYSAGSGPTLSSVPATAYPGQSRTVTGTGFGATQGTGGWTIGGVAQTITAWSDTSFTFTTVLGTNSYGAGKTGELTTDGGQTANDTIELVADTAGGFGVVTMSSPNTSDESSVAFGATPTVVTGDQFEWEDFNALGNLASDAQGFVESVDTEGTFRGRFWDATDSTWGAVETFTASTESTPAASSRGLKKGLRVTSLKRSLRRSL